MEENTRHMMIDGAAARRCFRGVEPRNLVLAVLATSPPVAFGDCLVSLDERVDQGSDFYLIELTGSNSREVEAQLEAAFTRLGIALVQPELVDALGFRPLARAVDGRWVEPL